MCPARETALAVSGHGVPVYEYVFSFEMHTNWSRIIHGVTATHGFEMPFVFDNWMHTLGMIFDKPERYQAMADVMGCTWASFVKCQKPRCPTTPESLTACDKVLDQVPEWTPYTAGDRQYMSFKTNSSMNPQRAHATFPNDEYPGDDRCDFWRNVLWEWQSMDRRPAAQDSLDVGGALMKLFGSLKDSFQQPSTVVI